MEENPDPRHKKTKKMKTVTTVHSSSPEDILLTEDSVITTGDNSAKNGESNFSSDTSRLAKRRAKRVSTMKAKSENEYNFSELNKVPSMQTLPRTVAELVVDLTSSDVGLAVDGERHDCFLYVIINVSQLCMVTPFCNTVYIRIHRVTHMCSCGVHNTSLSSTMSSCAFGTKFDILEYPRSVKDSSCPTKVVEMMKS